ncbi:MAG TPA: sortase [Chloroflexota bacterium]|jgi:LPXTG-site transpeptidase (sortase) family protein
MIQLIRFIGNALLVIGLVGLIQSLPAPVRDISIPLDLPRIAGVTDSRPPDLAVPDDLPAETVPITGIRAAAIGLDSEVIFAPLAEVHGAMTWEVPPFRVGHAEGTAGAGEKGNAVLMGHVISRTLGNVFQHLDQLQPGDQVSLFSDDREFVYQVTDVRAVSPSDVSVVEPTDTASVTLITCTGVWLTDLQDYSQRLVVRGVLA